MSNYLVKKQKKNTYTNQTDLQVKGSCVKPNSVKVDVTVFYLYIYLQQSDQTIEPIF